MITPMKNNSNIPTNIPTPELPKNGSTIRPAAPEPRNKTLKPEPKNRRETDPKPESPSKAPSAKTPVSQTLPENAISEPKAPALHAPIPETTPTTRCPDESPGLPQTDPLSETAAAKAPPRNRKPAQNTIRTREAELCGISRKACPSRTQAARELARREMFYFVRMMQPSLILENFHRTYYRVLDAFARGQIRHLVVTMPPQHGKSTGSSWLLPAYLLGLNPSLRIVLASYNLSLAGRFNRKIQQLIDTPLYERIFPATTIRSVGKTTQGTVRNREEFEVKDQGGGVLAVGREGALTGNAVDVLILDDLYKDALEANSPLVRENVWDWYNSVVKTRLHNHSQELIVSTRWHEDDLIGRLERSQVFVPLEGKYAERLSDSICSLSIPERETQKNAYPQSGQSLAEQSLSEPSDLEPPRDIIDERWFHLHFEAVKTGTPTRLDPRQPGEALWPQRHSIVLLEQKRRLDPLWFETLYQGKPSPAEGLLYGRQFELYDRLPDEILKKANYTDTADMGSDYLCSVCYVVGADGLIYVTGVVYTGDPMEVSEPQVAALLTDNDTRVARIESNNGGRGFARAVAKLTPRVRVEWFHQARNKEARILSNSATVLRMLRMPQDWALRWRTFHDDLVTYRRLYRANVRHDAPDVLTGIIETETVGNGNKKIRAVGFVAPAPRKKRISE